eukprot:2758707-Alexandrium_andersonii.AAC.1
MSGRTHSSAIVRTTESSWTRGPNTNSPFWRTAWCKASAARRFRPLRRNTSAARRRPTCDAPSFVSVVIN